MDASSFMVNITCDKFDDFKPSKAPDLLHMIIAS